MRLGTGPERAPVTQAISASSCRRSSCRSLPGVAWSEVFVASQVWSLLVRSLRVSALLAPRSPSLLLCCVHQSECTSKAVALLVHAVFVEKTLKPAGNARLPRSTRDVDMYNKMKCVCAVLPWRAAVTVRVHATSLLGIPASEHARSPSHCE